MRQDQFGDLSQIWNVKVVDEAAHRASDDNTEKKKKAGTFKNFFCVTVTATGLRGRIWCSGSTWRRKQEGSF